MRTTALAAMLCIVLGSAAQADPFQLKDDPRFSASAETGLFHLDDSQFNVTWLQPATLDLDWAPLASNRNWFPRLEVAALADIDRADLSYQDDGGGDLGGIHRARVSSSYGPTVGASLHATIYESSRWHLHLESQATTMIHEANVDAKELSVDVSGLQIDVAPAVRQYSRPTFDWRTLRAGLTGAVIFHLGSRRLVPYLTGGVFLYRATFAFRDLDPRLKTALVAFGVDSEIIRERSVKKAKPYFLVGARFDLSRRWSLEADAMAGQIDSAWFYSANIGATFRWNWPY